MITVLFVEALPAVFWQMIIEMFAALMTKSETKMLDETRIEFRTFSLIGGLELCPLQFSLSEHDSVPESPH